VLHDLRKQMLLSASAGYFHQSDKELRQFLEDELRHTLAQKTVNGLAWESLGRRSVPGAPFTRTNLVTMCIGSGQVSRPSWRTCLGLPGTSTYRPLASTPKPRGRRCRSRLRAIVDGLCSAGNGGNGRGSYPPRAPLLEFQDDNAASPHCGTPGVEAWTEKPRSACNQAFPLPSRGRAPSSSTRTARARDCRRAYCKTVQHRVAMLGHSVMPARGHIVAHHLAIASQLGANLILRKASASLQRN
jgi:hypothetical protein